ncbi:hypothetical protein BCR37DRAFT_383418, partial [Protomyces lactucae-debilis]
MHCPMCPIFVFITVIMLKISPVQADKSCVKADFYLQRIESDDDNDCAARCKTRLKEFAAAYKKDPDPCQRGNGAYHSLMAMMMDPFTTECVCQATIRFMRFSKPTDYSGTLDEVGNPTIFLAKLNDTCSTRNVLNRMSTKHGWGQTGLPPVFSKKQVKCTDPVPAIKSPSSGSSSD